MKSDVQTWTGNLFGWLLSLEVFRKLQHGLLTCAALLTALLANRLELAHALIQVPPKISLQLRPQIDHLGPGGFGGSRELCPVMQDLRFLAFAEETLDLLEVDPCFVPLH
jgi:hypothetical protein